ncbi:DUF2530 domain-containing protein [Kutzneria viridogrisea]|uniref:Uncharacterized protein n=2 Tax=Kutzneria TaxID=43356 RepID=W5VZN7_9PSEU|nr:DUF2530 domain-containing protein [Kutzneria albida]AHH93960.1 hypothetical protein KALB_584 [Kutzneria albida DSM 43870]MBA8931035.1 hypothetical protein [Kutzneria viridogrisea]
MAEKSKEEHRNEPVNPRTPPPLPKSLTDPVPVVVAGTALFLVAFLVLLVTGAPQLWTYSCLAGVVLGFSGYAVFRWQRAAARRGARGAQEGDGLI